MILQTVKLKNFKSYPDKETSIDLNFDGVKLLVGDNGHGKSTFFDAIIWCLYGKNKDGVDGVVNRKTKKNCKVEVEFKIGSTNYSIIRYRKHEQNGNKLLFFKNGKNISQRTAGATQELIDDIIEISYNAMVSSVVLSSELYTSFLRSTRADRLKTIESILSLKDVTLYYNKLKKLKSPVDEKVDELTREKMDLDVSITSLSDNIEEYKETVKKKLLKLKEEKTKLQEEVFELTKKIAEYDSIDIDKEILNNESYDRINEENKELKEKKEEKLKEITDVQEIIEQSEELRAELKKKQEIDIQAELDKNKRFKDNSDYNDRLDLAIEKLNSKKVDTFDLSLIIQTDEARLRDIEKEISGLENNSEVCPTCGQKVDKELVQNLVDEKVLLRAGILDDLAKNKKSLEDKLLDNKKVEEGIDKLCDKRVAFEAEDLPVYDTEELNNLSKEIYNLNYKIKFLQRDLENAELNNIRVKKEIKELDDKIEDNESGLNAPEYHTIFLKDLKGRMETLKDEAEEKRLRINDIDVEAKSSYDKGYVEKTNKAVASKIKLIKAVEKKLDKAVDDKNHYEALLTLLSNREEGFKKFFINKMIGVFNDRVNFYLPFFFDDEISIKFDKDLNETIKVNKEEVSFTSFSSGQKTRFDIAISFSLFMMVKMFFSSTINLLVFDEILDMNLDQKGFDSVQKIIENLGMNNSVFVVSHQEYYKEKFNHHIHIKMNNEKFSYIYAEV